MNYAVKLRSLLMVGVFLSMSLMTTGKTFAGETKIGVIDMQEVLRNSASGAQAQKDLETKMNELKATFKADEDAILTLEKEIEKKSSSWDENMTKQKGIELQKMRRDLGLKQEKTNLELKQLRQKHLTPILQKLEEVVKNQAQKGAFTIVMPKATVLYMADSVNMTAEITKALDEATK